jgi:ketosteroid isomerase-like protein
MDPDVQNRAISGDDATLRPLCYKDAKAARQGRDVRRPVVVYNGGASGPNNKELLMKLSAVYSCALLVFGMSALADAGPQADIRQLETDFNAAYAANDLDKYFGYYADDAVLWFQDGRTDIPSYKKEWTAFIKSGAQIQAGTTSDMHIRFSPQGDAAIASYLLHLKTKKADQKVTEEVFQETDVWFKTAGGWKITHVHYSDAPAATHK